MALPYNGKNVSLARKNRKNSTKQENRLWYDFLRTYPVKFRRQQPIDNYIADFYCREARLVIEVDGIQHESEEGQKRDAVRTEVLERYGWKVIRIPNRYIDNDFFGVCKYLDRTIQEIIGGTIPQ